MLKRFRFSSFTLPLIVLASLSGLIFLQSGRFQQIRAIPSQNEIINNHKKQLASLKLFSQLPVGSYRNLVASWLFLDYFQYLGDFDARKVTGYGLITPFFSEVVRNDPKFVDAYLYLSPMNSLYAGRPDQTVALMNRGLPALSPSIKDAYYVWLYKGVDELLFLDNAAEARNSYQMAAQWAIQQDDENSRQVAQNAQGSAKFLENSSISRKAKISAWMALMGHVQGDEKMERFILQRIVALGAKISIAADGSLEVTMPPETNDPTTPQSANP
jgi:hypothetical protein